VRLRRDVEQCPHQLIAHTICQALGGRIGKLQLLKLLDMDHHKWQRLLLLVHEAVVGGHPLGAVATAAMRLVMVVSPQEREVGHVRLVEGGNPHGEIEGEALVVVDGLELRSGNKGRWKHKSKVVRCCHLFVLGQWSSTIRAVADGGGGNEHEHGEGMSTL
jgi:hypothetical protein